MSWRDTNARLKRVEQESDAAQSLIPADVQSVCLLHVSVAFHDHEDRPTAPLCPA